MIDQFNHILDGASGCGKGNLQKNLARLWHRKGWPVFVHNPNHEPGYEGFWQTADNERFLHVCKKNRRYVAILNEASVFCPKHCDEKWKWIVKQIRHNDAFSILATQRFTQVDPEVRESCAVGCLFNMDEDRAAYWAKVYCCSQLKKILPNTQVMKPFHWLHVSMVKGVRRLVLNPPTPEIQF